MVLVASVLSVFVAAVSAQEPLQLYIQENSRLKKQLTALEAELAQLRARLEQEKASNQQLRATLERVKPLVDNHDREVNALSAQLRSAEERLQRQRMFLMLSIWIIGLLVLLVLVYIQRHYFLKLIRRVIDESSRRHHRQPLEDNTIKPEEIAQRLYGSRR